MMWPGVAEEAARHEGVLRPRRCLQGRGRRARSFMSDRTRDELGRRRRQWHGVGGVHVQGRELARRRRAVARQERARRRRADGHRLELQARAPPPRSSARTTSSPTAAISRTSCRPTRPSGTTSARTTTTHQGDVGARRHDGERRGDDDRHDRDLAGARIGLAAARQPHARRDDAGQSGSRHAEVDRGRSAVRAGLSARDGRAGARPVDHGVADVARPRSDSGQEKTGGASDDIGDIMWSLPTATLSFPSNIPGATGHHWTSAVAMATPVAHKGATQAAKVEAMTILDLLMRPELVRAARTTSRTSRARRRIPAAAAAGRQAGRRDEQGDDGPVQAGAEEVLLRPDEIQVLPRPAGRAVSAADAAGAGRSRSDTAINESQRND